MRKKLPKSNWNNAKCIEDRRMGRINEKWFDEWLVEKDFFKTDWETRKECKTNWDIIDYKSDPNELDKQIRYIELKSRKNRVDSFWDTMIGENKLIEARKLMDKGFKVYFFFLFTGKSCKERELYFFDSEKCRYELYKEPSKGLYCSIKLAGTTRRGKWEKKPHLFIPYKLLHSVKKYDDIMDYHRKQK
tara:strand:- start:4924 stop:5490 length:567 start_codon:yes stop_codon:yes gene_type:complete